jgi:hypothetical protein
MVEITFAGVIRREDMDDCADGIMTPATLSYRKLVDLRECLLALSPADVAAIAERVRAHNRDKTLGAVAFVAQEGGQQSRLFEALSVAADRPLKVFSEARAAREWLDGIASHLDGAPTSSLGGALGPARPAQGNTGW